MLVSRVGISAKYSQSSVINDCEPVVPLYKVSSVNNRKVTALITIHNCDQMHYMFAGIKA